MADVTFTATLDDKGVMRGLASIESGSGAFAGKAASNLGVAASAAGKVQDNMAKGIAKTIGLYEAFKTLNAAVAEYAKKNQDAAQWMEKLAKHKSEFFSDIGRDIFAGGDTFDMLIEKMRMVRDFASSGIGAWWRVLTKFESPEEAMKNIQMADAALKKSEEMQKQLAIAQKIKEVEDRSTASNLRSAGNVLDADKWDAYLQLQKELKDIAKESKEFSLPTDVSAKMRVTAEAKYQAAIVKAEADDVERKAKAEQEAAKAIEDQRKAAQDADKEASDKREERRLARTEFGVQRDTYALTIQRAGKSKEELTAMERKVRLSEELLKIERMQNITQEERQLLAADAALAAAIDVENLLAGPSKKGQKNAAAFIEAGNFGSTSLLAAFGPGQASVKNAPGLEEAREQVKLARTTVQTLSKISERVADVSRSMDGNGLVARFGQ